MLKKNICVLGDGGWGTAISILLHKNRHKVSLWGYFPENISQMRQKRINEKFLPGIFIPEEIFLTDDLNSAVNNSDIIVSAVPSQFTRAILKLLSSANFAGKIIVNLAKGIENDSLKRMSEVFHDELGENFRYCVLSGPSHAEEVAAELPTAVVVASKDESASLEVQRIFMNKNFRVYTSGDVIGVELGGSLKNIFAIAAGISDGMRLGDNAKAALITRGIAELSKFGTALGGAAKTFSGLSGIGDLIVTCMSRHSRNRFVGEELGKGRPLQEIISSMGRVVAEGVATCKSAYELAQKLKIETPIINEVYAGLYSGKEPRQCVIDLMTRKAKSEF